METRSKGEIARDIEATRRELYRVWRDTASVLPGDHRTPTWNVAQETGRLVQKGLSSGAHWIQGGLASGARKTDEAAHRKPYLFLAAALVAGIVIALAATPKARRCT